MGAARLLGSDAVTLGRRLLQMLVLIGVQALALFVGAGSLAWPAGWVYVGLYAGLAVIGATVLLPRHSGVVVERSRGAAGGKRWDFWLTRLLVLATMAVLGTAGVDRRLGWPPQLPTLVGVLGALVFVAGYLVVLWAMSVNAYFSQTVRIQTERGHAVVTEGPYAVVRHPGYVGMLTCVLGACFLLGSLWALVPWLLYLGMTVVRTEMEDHTLHAELSGYPEYAGRTRYRLMPGIW
jgi:protein-S-isoprenylcysteine O-methyltransferase Ste14